MLLPPARGGRAAEVVKGRRTADMLEASLSCARVDMEVRGDRTTRNRRDRDVAIFTPPSSGWLSPQGFISLRVSKSLTYP